MDVLRHGANVEVVKPDALRKRIQKETRRLLTLYADNAGRSDLSDMP